MYTRHARNASVMPIDRIGVIYAHLSPEWSLALSDFAAWLIAAGMAPSSQRIRCYHVRRLAEAVHLPPDKLELDDLVEYFAAQEWAPETRRGNRASIVKFMTWMHSSGRRPDNPAALLPTVSVPTGSPRPTPEKILRSALIASSPRTRLMVSLGAFVGLRRGEIATTRGDAVGEDLDGPVLRVTGKGGHVRVVPLDEGIAEQITARGPGWTFPGQIDGHLSPAHVGKLVSRVMPEGWTAHSLRHRFASAAYAHERDIRAVQELLGHKSVRTTQMYTAVPDRARRSAASAAAAGFNHIRDAA